jgi:hypothetical protein
MFKIMFKVRSILTAVAAGALAAALPAAFAQSTFTGFSPGNLVLSRSVYSGDSSTIVIGQALPPVCPSTAACGTGVATDNGSYPSLANSNNVWNNDAVDVLGDHFHGQ